MTVNEKIRNIIPWLYLLLFNSAFGFSIFLTWNYNHKYTNHSNVALTTIVTPDPGDIRYNICEYTCDKSKFLQNGNALLVCNVWIMTIVLPYCAATGMNIKSIWNRIKIKLYFRYSTRNSNFWKELFLFVEHIHPTTPTDTMFANIVSVDVVG